MSKVGNTLTKTVTPSILGLGAAAFSAASDLQDASGAVEAVYGESAESVLKLGENAAKSAGMSESAYLNQAAVLGGMTQAMGFSADQSAKLSESTLQLSADLASFYGTDQEQAFNALKGALAGETEGLKAFGVVINQAAIEQKALEEGLWDGEGALDANAKAAATHALVMEQTTQIQGDYARTSDSAANSAKSMRAQLSDAAATIGTQLIPIGTRLIQTVAGWFEAFSNLSPQVQQVIVTVLGVAAAIGPLLIAGAKLVQAFKVIRTAFVAVRAVMMANPYALLIAATVAVVVLIVKNWDKIKKFLTKVWNAIKKVAKTIFNAIKAYFTTVFGVYSKIILGVWNGIQKAVKAIWNGIKKAARVVFDAIKAYFTTVLGLYKRAFMAVWNGIKRFLGSVWNGIKRVASTVWGNITGVFRRFLEKARNIFNNVKSAITGAFQAAKDKVIGVWDGLVRGIKGKINNIIRFINRLISAWNNLGFKFPGFSKTIFGKEIGIPSFTISTPDIPTVPYLAEGGDILRAGLAVVGERGPELLQMPRGARVSPLDKAHGVTVENLIVNINGTFDMSSASERRRVAERIRDEIIRLEMEVA